jgi:hypothetical protein
MMVAAFYRTYNWKKRKQVPLPMHAKKWRIFNYATLIIIKPNLGKQIPTLSNADYLNFKQFLKTQKISLTRKQNRH